VYETCPEASEAGASLVTIGGTCVRTRSACRVVDGPQDDAYSSFLSPDPGAGRLSAAIDVEVLAYPSPPNHSPTIFDSDIAWHMQPEADGYRVSFRRTDREAIHTVMISNQSSTELRIYVDEDEPHGGLPCEGIHTPVRAPLDQVLFMNYLAFDWGVICHSAAAVVGKHALLFPGYSGAGKSTLCRMFVAAGMGDCLLSDDRVILRVDPETKTGGGVTAWGTPWHGDALIARNKSAPLAAMLFLVQHPSDELVPISPGAAMRRLMPVVSTPWYDADRLSPVLETCGRLVETIPCYELRFTTSGGIVDILTTRSWS
jgi:hypothetical protein